MSADGFYASGESRHLPRRGVLVEDTLGDAAHQLGLSGGDRLDSRRAALANGGEKLIGAHTGLRHHGSGCVFAEELPDLVGLRQVQGGPAIVVLDAGIRALRQEELDDTWVAGHCGLESVPSFR